MKGGSKKRSVKDVGLWGEMGGKTLHIGMVTGEGSVRALVKGAISILVGPASERDRTAGGGFRRGTVQTKILSSTGAGEKGPLIMGHQ